MGTLTDATLPDDDEKGRAYTLVKQLLASAVFKVSPFSLQCVDFDEGLYNRLRLRFEVSVPVGKRKQLFQSERGTNSKRKKTG